jgi:hypothetical protein
MTRDHVIRALTFMGVAGCALFGVFALILFVGAAIATDGMALAAAFFTAFVSGSLGVGAWFLSNMDHNDGISSLAEQQLLTPAQKRELRRARAGVVMEKALIDVEHERQNITHRQIEASKDPNKPPHQTSWTEVDYQRQLEQANDDDGYGPPEFPH